MTSLPKKNVFYERSVPHRMLNLLVLPVTLLLCVLVRRWRGSIFYMGAYALLFCVGAGAMLLAHPLRPLLRRLRCARARMFAPKAPRRRVVRALLSSPQDGTFLSAKDVARRASVHPTSAVRLAQKLGFTGYRDFR